MMKKMVITGTVDGYVVAGTAGLSVFATRARFDFALRATIARLGLDGKLGATAEVRVWLNDGHFKYSRGTVHTKGWTSDGMGYFRGTWSEGGRRLFPRPREIVRADRARQQSERMKTAWAGKSAEQRTELMRRIAQMPRKKAAPKAK